MTMLNKISVILALLITASWSQAEVYSYQDDNGNTVYSDKKPSENARPSKSSASVNYFNDSSAKPKQIQSLPTLEAFNDAIASTSESDNKGEDLEPAMTEALCQQQYSRSCDKVENWLEYAKQDCRDDSRCDDLDYLERKYRPRSNAEIQKISRRAATRNNLAEKKIALFLQKRYTNYCADQAAMYCKSYDNQCSNRMLSYCKDPRGLADIFQKYDNLSPLEKQQIIAKAKEMTIRSGMDDMDYEKLVAGLIDILISQAMMGI
ncbi:MAG: hypothetical protein ACJAYG_001858 [Oceanicoccus sp.]|jgi:hypothetical protein